MIKMLYKKHKKYLLDSVMEIERNKKGVINHYTFVELKSDS